jgi:uncharacterized membrane protein
MWNGPYRTVSYLNSTLWTIPFLAIVLVLAIAPALRILDAQLGWNSGLGVAGAQALYQTVITLTLSFLVFTFGSLLVALQVASGQLTPRIIATTLLRDNVLRYTSGCSSSRLSSRSSHSTASTRRCTKSSRSSQRCSASPA